MVSGEKIITLLEVSKNNLEDTCTKGLTRSHTPKKDISRQYHEQNKKAKRTNNDLQNITQKIKDRETR